jgi:hypothetical protein
MSYVACTQGNQVDSQLLVVGNQTANLTPGHFLAITCVIDVQMNNLDIYTLVDFQWYKELFKARNFDSCNRALKIRDSFWNSNSQHGSSFVSVRVHSLTLFALPRACEMTPRSPSWPATLQPLALVTSPRLRLQQRVIILMAATLMIEINPMNF